MAVSPLHPIVRASEGTLQSLLLMPCPCPSVSWDSKEICPDSTSLKISGNFYMTFVIFHIFSPGAIYHPLAFFTCLGVHVHNIELDFCHITIFRFNILGGGFFTRGCQILD